MTTLTRRIAATAAWCIVLAFVPAAHAASASDACVALAEARGALYEMLSAKDKAALDALHAKVRAASGKLDVVLAGMTGADAKAAADFKVVWEQFKMTRDKEIIPALYRGNAGDAKKIADGVQYERLTKMWGIMSCNVK